jgi:hypothetical protein
VHQSAWNYDSAAIRANPSYTPHFGSPFYYYGFTKPDLRFFLKKLLLLPGTARFCENIPLPARAINFPVTGEPVVDARRHGFTDQNIHGVQAPERLSFSRLFGLRLREGIEDGPAPPGGGAAFIARK